MMQSKTKHFQKKKAEQNCVLSAVYSVFRDEMEYIIFSKYTEWKSAFLLGLGNR